MDRMMEKKRVIRHLRGNEFFPAKGLIRSSAEGGAHLSRVRERTRKFLCVR